jgi:hypothetical protein
MCNNPAVKISNPHLSKMQLTEPRDGFPAKGIPQSALYAAIALVRRAAQIIIPRENQLSNKKTGQVRFFIA